MLDLSAFIDLPLFFVGIIALAIFLYVVLDGFDLGVGIMFPFAPSDECRNKMMNSIAPFWDGNETWLVLGGMVLFAAFPRAYSIILPSLYIPVICMLIGLIMRGVALELRSKAENKSQRKLWDYSFHFGSLTTVFAQGVMLGCFVQGFYCESGICHVWFTPFSCLVGIALVAGYALLGSCWIIMKTEGRTQNWARRVAIYATVFVALFIVLISAWTPSLNPEITKRWFGEKNIFYLAPIPLLTLLNFYLLVHALLTKKEKQPFFLSLILFALCYLGLAVTLFPFILPYFGSFSDLAASPQSLSFLFVGVVITLPVVLAFTFYSYRVFRGKSSHENLY